MLRDKGDHPARVLTVGGELKLSRKYYWAKGCGGQYPQDAALGIEQSRTSPGALEVLCRLGMTEDFAAAAEDARRIGNVVVGREKLRQLVEAEAERITQTRNQSKLAPAWTVKDTKLAGSDKTRMYTGVDGVMAPMVTQDEKDTRRKKQVARRQQRGQTGVGNTKPLPAARPGHDERFREMKIGVFYDQEKAHRHVMAAAGKQPVFAPLYQAHAGQVGFEQADESISLTDGAKWIIGTICRMLLLIKATLLDFYHLSQHVHATAKTCFGEGEKATAWALEQLKGLKELGVRPLLAAIETLDRKTRSLAKKKSLRLLREYVTDRLEMLDYPAAIAKGWDIGSGPTEAMCKNLTLRLKRPGMKWDADHAEGMMNLIAMYESGQSKTYWASLSSA